MKNFVRIISVFSLVFLGYFMYQEVRVLLERHRFQKDANSRAARLSHEAVLAAAEAARPYTDLERKKEINDCVREAEHTHQFRRCLSLMSTAIDVWVNNNADPLRESETRANQTPGKKINELKTRLDDLQSIIDQSWKSKQLGKSNREFVEGVMAVEEAVDELRNWR